MVSNELYKGNKNPVTGQTPEAGKPAGDSSMKNGVAARSVTGDKLEVEKPVDDGAVKSRIEDAWDAKQPDVIKDVPDNYEIIASNAKPAAGQTLAADPDVKPIIK